MDGQRICKASSATVIAEPQPIFGQKAAHTRASPDGSKQYTHLCECGWWYDENYIYIVLTEVFCIHMRVLGLDHC